MKLETRLFLSDLTHLDCAWFDPLDGLVGETWRVDAELGGELADNGMLCDFGIVKSTLKQALDADVDHRLLLTQAQATDLLEEQQQGWIELRTVTDETYRYRAPLQSFALLDCNNITALDIATSLQNRLISLLPDNITTLNLRLTPAHARGAYRYCHGLRQHAGNCQRMAHGHRADLAITLDGQRNAALEQQWQSKLDGRYIGSAEDLQTHGQRHRYAYRGSQGEFELELPQHRSCPIDAEPTIEHITRYIVSSVAREHPGHQVGCRAFEGIGKGASAQLIHSDQA